MEDRRVMHSLLEKCRPEDVRLDPFPHLVVDDALPEEVYRILEADFPDPHASLPAKLKGRTSYGYARYGAADFLTDGRLKPSWRGFWELHLSREFAAGWRELFSEPIRRLYPQVLDLPVGGHVRNHTPAAKGGLQLEGQMVWRCKPDRADDVIDPHLDNPQTLLFLLWYVPCPGDAAEGGGLRLYRAGPDTAWQDRNAVSGIEPAVLVPYRPNQLVLCLNTPLAVHGGQERAPSPLPRRHVNLNLELNGVELFPLPGQR
jgi:hypothetical protein